MNAFLFFLVFSIFSGPVLGLPIANSIEISTTNGKYVYNPAKKTVSYTNNNDASLNTEIDLNGKEIESFELDQVGKESVIFKFKDGIRKERYIDGKTLDSLNTRCIDVDDNAEGTKYMSSRGTIFLYPNTITDNHPTSFQLISSPETKTEVPMYDRKAIRDNGREGGRIKATAFVYNVTFDDGHSTRINVRKKTTSGDTRTITTDDYTEAGATEIATVYAKMMGRLPAVLREGVNDINIMKGDGSWGGLGGVLDIQIGKYSEGYKTDGIREETLVHEACHAVIDAMFYETAEWNEARDTDPLYISHYGYDCPRREDIAESFVPFMASLYGKERISQDQLTSIEAAIPQRLQFFKAKNLDLYPYIKEEETKPDPIVTTPDPAPTTTPSANDLSGLYRLKTKFRGENECLEGNEAGSNVQGGNAFMTSCQDVKGQVWKIEAAGDGFYRLKTLFRGEGECLEGNEAGSNIHGGSAFMTPCQNMQGQLWKIVDAGNGYYYLKTKFRGDGECLEGNEAGSNIHRGNAFMAPCANATGQMWKLEKVGETPASGGTSNSPIAGTGSTPATGVSRGSGSGPVTFTIEAPKGKTIIFEGKITIEDKNNP